MMFLNLLYITFSIVAITIGSCINSCSLDNTTLTCHQSHQPDLIYCQQLYPNIEILVLSWKGLQGLTPSTVLSFEALVDVVVDLDEPKNKKLFRNESLYSSYPLVGRLGRVRVYKGLREKECCGQRIESLRGIMKDMDVDSYKKECKYKDNCDGVGVTRVIKVEKRNAFTGFIKYQEKDVLKRTVNESNELHKRLEDQNKTEFTPFCHYNIVLLVMFIFCVILLIVVLVLLIVYRKNFCTREECKSCFGCIEKVKSNNNSLPMPSNKLDPFSNNSIHPPNNADSVEGLNTLRRTMSRSYLLGGTQQQPPQTMYSFNNSVEAMASSQNNPQNLSDNFQPNNNALPTSNQLKKTTLISKFLKLYRNKAKKGDNGKAEMLSLLHKNKISMPSSNNFHPSNNFMDDFEESNNNSNNNNITFFNINNTNDEKFQENINYHATNNKSGRTSNDVFGLRNNSDMNEGEVCQEELDEICMDYLYRRGHYLP